MLALRAALRVGSGTPVRVPASALAAIVAVEKALCNTRPPQKGLALHKGPEPRDDRSSAVYLVGGFYSSALS